jgi:hypothetical protein
MTSLGALPWGFLASGPAGDQLSCHRPVTAAAARPLYAFYAAPTAH